MMVQGSGKDAANFFNGFAKGLVGADIGDLDQCVGATNFMPSIESAVENFKSKNPLKIANGIFQLFTATLSIQNVLLSCGSISKDAASKLISMAKTFSSLSSITSKVSRNIFVHIGGITKGIIGATSDFSSKNFYGAGYNIGRVTIKCLG